MDSPSRRLLPMLVAVVALLLAACSEIPAPTSSALIAPTNALHSYSFPKICDANGQNCVPCTLVQCVGDLTDNKPVQEQLKVCKMYPAGTVNPPAVDVQMDIVTTNIPLTPTSIRFTVQPNTCLLIWQNGEQIGPAADQATVTEVVPSGYTATTQVTSIIRNGPRNGPATVYDTTVNAATATNTATGLIGGPQIPGMVVTFTNTLIPPPPPGQSCTFTQGYWKNHESAWPAPYAATNSWLDATHVTPTTWDGLLGMSVAGGNSYMQLAHQWIAATLNHTAGAPMSPAALAALNSGETWLRANTPANGPVPLIKNAQANGWASTLDSYNNGLLGTPHCE